MNHVDPSLIKGLAIGFGAIGPAIGVGLIGASAVGAIGRNPEMQGRILSTAFVMAGLVDAVLAFVLLIVFTTS
ncbi:MAG: ATP synthase F0 subunit C [Candidatus Saccharimonadales bacterium]|jgi:F-type H+-transporting ATPase subunit c